MKSLPTSVAALTTLVQQLYTENQQLKQRISELELKLKKHRIDPPPAVKANTPLQKKVKKRTQRVKAYVRYRSLPDEIIVHAYTQCPHCHTPVTGNAIAYEREVIELPPIRLKVIRHRILKRHCMGCGAWVTPKVDFSREVVGHSRFGVRLTSLITTLRERGRLPVRVIGTLFRYLTNTTLSNGEIIEMSHQVAHQGRAFYYGLQKAVQHAPVVYADETGHRENGQNGYVWNVTTPKIRFYVYRLSRGKTVVDEILGDTFAGIVTSDFYAAYNHVSTEHQRCWAHLLRKMHQTAQLYAHTTYEQEIGKVSKKLTHLYRQGKSSQQQTLTLSQRHSHRRHLETSLLRLVKPYLTDKTHPLHTLAKRIDYYGEELFTFVLDPKLDPTNNPAERAVRHQVIKRKISGGTRSAQGSQTQERLTTFFSTWVLNQQNPIEECIKLLTSPNYATQFIQEL